jgi:exodeoxyribonuclease V alpha subunit
MIPDVEFSALDLHFAQFMTRLAGRDEDAITLAAALASRATANGDVCVDLREYAAESMRSEKAAGPLGARTTQIPGPPLGAWLRSLRASPVIGRPGEFRPLVLDEKGRLYLYRYWDYERRLAEDLIERAVDADDVDENLLRRGLDRFFPLESDHEQKLAAAMAVLRRLCVISGGPGTGKTTTVVKILALIAEQARGRRLAIGLAAPTGKAAARVQDAIRRAVDALQLDACVMESIPPEAFTLHRLLGARPDSIYYRHGRNNRLALDVLVVDEASMADLALAAKLVEALRADSRLILIGDKDQLASVEAGAVLGDICAEPGVSSSFAKRVASLTGIPAKRIPQTKTPRPLSDSIAILTRSYRFGPESGIGALARLVNAGDGSAALRLMQAGESADVAWRGTGGGDFGSALTAALDERLIDYFDAVRRGSDVTEIFDRFNAFRVLCAHRAGRTGVLTVNRRIEDALEAKHGIATGQTWYAGRPVMITRNDYNVRLFNGDVGIALADPEDGGRLKIYFHAGAGGPAAAQRVLRKFAPARLPDHETVYAMTIHKSQGSEFGDVLIVLPSEPSPIVTRELVYTGITRAMKRVEIWGTETTFCDAVERPLVRGSGLREKLWNHPVLASGGRGAAGTLKPGRGDPLAGI